MPKKITISGEIGWEVTPDQIRQNLADAKGDDLDIEISSPGGSVFKGVLISSLIRDYKKENPNAKISATLKSLIASMATYISSNSAINLVAVDDDASFMIHNPTNGTYGDYREMKKNADFLERLTGMMRKTYSSRSKKSEKEISKMMDDETWFFGEEIVAAGFADEVIKTGKEKNKAKALDESKTVFALLNEKIKSEKEDFSQIAAMLESYEPEAISENKESKNNKENRSMETLQEFLEKNPAAMKEYNSAIAAAVKQGEDRVRSASTRVAAIISEEKYKEALPNAIKVLSGEMEIGTFEAGIQMLDMLAEKIKSSSAKTETAENGNITTQPAVESNYERMKKSVMEV